MNEFRIRCRTFASCQVRNIESLSPIESTARRCPFDLCIRFRVAIGDRLTRFAATRVALHRRGAICSRAENPGMAAARPNMTLEDIQGISETLSRVRRRNSIIAVLTEHVFTNRHRESGSRSATPTSIKSIHENGRATLSPSCRGDCLLGRKGDLKEIARRRAVVAASIGPRLPFQTRLCQLFPSAERREGGGGRTCADASTRLKGITSRG